MSQLLSGHLGRLLQEDMGAGGGHDVTRVFYHTVGITSHCAGWNFPAPWNPTLGILLLPLLPLASPEGNTLLVLALVSLAPITSLVNQKMCLLTANWTHELKYELRLSPPWGLLGCCIVTHIFGSRLQHLQHLRRT